ncbi:MAG: hypothetical protein ACI9JM_000814 [Halioglobus sp.]|jgi:hypothetical protein
MNKVLVAGLDRVNQLRGNANNCRVHGTNIGLLTAQYSGVEKHHRLSGQLQTARSHDSWQTVPVTTHTDQGPGHNSRPNDAGVQTE